MTEGFYGYLQFSVIYFKTLTLYFCPTAPDLNAKGTIFQTFEVYRLKSCVEFKPYEGEKAYIVFEKRDG